MGIILFLVDTSASMNQKTYLGTSYLDVAKVAIETFMKYRMRDPASRGDRYMLISFDEPPNAIKAGWKENHATFVSQLKNLEATGLSTFGRSLKEAFDLLNVHRLHTSIDHYGQGRNPFFLEPAVIIVLTDGGKLTNQSTVETELTLPLLTGAGEGRELTKEPFRWDQRLFSIILRLPGLSGSETLQESCHVSVMCEATGGKCYVVSTHKSLVQSVESLTQKLHPGVVVNFQRLLLDGDDTVPMEVDGEETSRDKDTPPPSSEWHNTRKMLYVKSNPKTNVPSGFWPIPESFWSDPSGASLPPRDAHPIVWFDPTDKEPMLVENFPFDKYELEPSPLTQHILSRRKPNVCWQVFIESSSKQSGLVHSFGYLKASSSLTHVTLFVMPFNYPCLLPLIEELGRTRMRPSPKWKQDFAEYIATVPSYYAAPLRNALRLMGAPTNLISDTFDGQLSYTVTSYLKKLKKQAKTESERVVSAVGKGRAISLKSSNIVDLGDNISLAIGSTDEGLTSQSFRNPYDIPRHGLLPQLTRMRTNFLHTTSTTPNLLAEIHRHELPVGQMGNYQEHLKRINPLRELDSGAVRTQLFGNPFKLERPADNKKVDDGIDMFADEHMVEMNRRPGLRSPRQRRRSRTTTPPRLIKPSPQPPTLNEELSTSPDTTNHADSAELSEPLPFVSSSLPEENSTGTASVQPTDSNSTESKSNSLHSSSVDKSTEISVSSTDGHAPLTLTNNVRPDDKTAVEKVQATSRKRERTPSPTYSVIKRPALNNSSLTKFTSSALPTKTSSKVTGGGLKSSASKVLTEELQKQQGQENSRLKGLIVKEVRKPGKNYEVIFQHLEGVKGTVELRETFVLDVIKEATKFKKWKLVEQLEDWSGGLKALSLKADTNNYKPPIKSKPTQKR